MINQVKQINNFGKFSVKQRPGWWYTISCTICHLLKSREITDILDMYANLEDKRVVRPQYLVALIYEYI